jgi:general secretion pathway protein H
MHSHPDRKFSTGFTLLELLVVLTIVGLLTMLAPPLYSKAVPGAMLKNTSLDFAISLREARSKAINSSKRVNFTLLAIPPSYIIGNTSAVPLPDGITVAAYNYHTLPSGSLVKKPALEDDEIIIGFYPDGSSSGASVAISNGTTAYRINISWLTGNITMSEAQYDDS